MYVYLLQSKSHPQQRYIGSTKNIKQRIQEHNQGPVAAAPVFAPKGATTRQASLLLKGYLSLPLLRED